MEKEETSGFIFEKWTEEVKTRKDMLHYKSFEDYKNKMQKEGKPLKLVVGCGHGAFRWDINKQALVGTHKGYETFSHEDAFTINFMDGKQGPSLGTDINGAFPEDLPKESKEQFDEIYFEEVEGGTVQYYKDAFDFLKPGGKIMDDHHSEFNEVDMLPRMTAFNALTKVGFTDIEFQKWEENPHNLRKLIVIVAKKPS